MVAWTKLVAAEWEIGPFWTGCKSGANLLMKPKKIFLWISCQRLVKKKWSKMTARFLVEQQTAIYEDGNECSRKWVVREIKELLSFTLIAMWIYCKWSWILGLNVQSKGEKSGHGIQMWELSVNRYYLKS